MPINVPPVTDEQGSVSPGDYYISQEEKEGGQRWLHVAPYFYTFRVSAKGRWVGQTALAVFTAEFPHHTSEYYTSALSKSRLRIERSIKKGLLQQKGAPGDVCILTNPDEKIEQGDYLVHEVHRHELPICVDAPLEILYFNSDDGLLVLSKPASWPVHPCGRFHRNSVVSILEAAMREANDEEVAKSSRNGRIARQLLRWEGVKMHGESPPSAELRGLAAAVCQGKLHTCHRLDRSTSGVLVLATKLKAAQMLQPLLSLSEDEMKGSAQLSGANSGGKLASKMYVARVSGKFPSHPVGQPPLSLTRPIYCASHTEGRFACVPYDVDETPKRVGISKHDEKESLSPASVGGQGNDNTSRGTSCGSTKKKRMRSEGEVCASDEIRERGKNVEGKNEIKNKNDRMQKQSLYGKTDENALDERNVKAARTDFWSLAFSPALNESLVLCQPFTGRTHQIRVHLLFLGFPIVNDAMYNPGLPSTRLSSATAAAAAKVEQTPVLEQSINTCNADCGRELSFFDRDCAECTGKLPSGGTGEGCMIFLHALQFSVLCSISVPVLLGSQQADSQIKEGTTSIERSADRGGRRYCFRAPLPAWAQSFEGFEDMLSDPLFQGVGEECCVCLQPLSGASLSQQSSSQQIISQEEACELGCLSCGHTFHYLCIMQHLEHQRICPLCRQHPDPCPRSASGSRSANGLSMGNNALIQRINLSKKSLDRQPLSQNPAVTSAAGASNMQGHAVTDRFPMSPLQRGEDVVVVLDDHEAGPSAAATGFTVAVQPFDPSTEDGMDKGLLPQRSKESGDNKLNPLEVAAGDTAYAQYDRRYSKYIHKMERRIQKRSREAENVENRFISAERKAEKLRAEVASLKHVIRSAKADAAAMNSITEGQPFESPSGGFVDEREVLLRCASRLSHSLDTHRAELEVLVRQRQRAMEKERDLKSQLEQLEEDNPSSAQLDDSRADGQPSAAAHAPISNSTEATSETEGKVMKWLENIDAGGSTAGP